MSEKEQLEHIIKAPFLNLSDVRFVLKIYGSSPSVAKRVYSAMKTTYAIQSKKKNQVTFARSVPSEICFSYFETMGITRKSLSEYANR